MDTIKGAFKSLSSIAALTGLSVSVTNAQNALQFTGITATVEGAIQLSWQSETNTVYEIQYADGLIDASLGGTVWQSLYTDYPSHGSNTFWLDTGNYNLTPPIPHPRNSGMRFYRIYNLGTNTGPAPSISITSPSNGATISGYLNITVSASSDQDLIRTLLFVDGQEMPFSGDGTNFVVNTCEWPNGSHTLFAVVKSQFGFEGTPNDTSVTYGRAVSTCVNVTFDNLITRYSWSEPYFEPALGQTQQVSAVFAANANWTLEVLDATSNVVLTTTGSGAAMAYNWDGTGQGGTNLPAGAYWHRLTAQTNGLPLPLFVPPPGSSNDLPPGLNGAMVQSQEYSGSVDYPTTEGQALAAGLTSYFAPPPPMPPVKTNGVWVAWKDVFGLQPWTEIQIPLNRQERFLQSLVTANAMTLDGFGPLDVGYSGPSSQSTVGPTRPPNIPGQGTIGTIGVGYQTYVTASGTFTTPPIQRTPNPIPTYIALDGRSSGQASQPETWAAIKENAEIADSFIRTMKSGRYSAPVVKANDSFTSSDLKNGAFNQVNVGLILLHSSYATTVELDGLRHVYLRFLNSGGSTDYVKLDKCAPFGGPGTNGLKWMAILACNVLRSPNYNDLYDVGDPPIGNDLHLLLGTSTLSTAAPDVGKLWAFNMLGPEQPAMTVEQAWYQAGKDAYKAETDYPNLLINFRVAGWPDAFTDKLADVGNTPGTGNPYDITQTTEKVHPLP